MSQNDERVCYLITLLDINLHSIPYIINIVNELSHTHPTIIIPLWLHLTHHMTDCNILQIVESIMDTIFWGALWDWKCALNIVSYNFRQGNKMANTPLKN